MGALRAPLRSFVAEATPRLASRTASLREAGVRLRLRNAKSFAEGEAGEARERPGEGGTQCPARPSACPFGGRPGGWSLKNTSYLVLGSGEIHRLRGP